MIWLFSRGIFALSLVASVLIVFDLPMARAQTAEETVLFMVLGYEKDSPTRPINLSISIQKTSNCKYFISTKFNGKTEELAFDFTSLKEYRIVPEDYGRRTRVIINGSDLFAVKERNTVTGLVNERRENVFSTSWPSSVASTERLQTAVTYFRANFCKGRAF
jgi:hypothetical protein